MLANETVTEELKTAPWTVDHEGTPFTFYPEEKKVEAGGTDLGLSKTEYDFLVLLAQYPGKVVTHRMFLPLFRETRSKSSRMSITKVFVWNISNMKCAPKGVKSPIQNIYGRGYRFGDAAPQRVTREDLKKRLALNESFAHLPVMPVPRWNVNQKETVVLFYTSGVLTQEDVLGYYSDMRGEELTEWVECRRIHGPDGLAPTKIYAHL